MVISRHHSTAVPPSGGSLEIGNMRSLICSSILGREDCSPFGGIPRNWKQVKTTKSDRFHSQVPPSGGSLEIGNYTSFPLVTPTTVKRSPFGGIPRNWKQTISFSSVGAYSISSPFGGIPRNWKRSCRLASSYSISAVPPSGGSLEIGNLC